MDPNEIDDLDLSDLKISEEELKEIREREKKPFILSLLGITVKCPNCGNTEYLDDLDLEKENFSIRF